MFSIIISEKGGAERREGFDKNEINVGRVQGNDLMLPKGNVSKHHARLLFRDGRFIVTDLKSTNGTYVNGRKIAQATIVREGDKIYIGDFVLRLDAGVNVSDGTPQPDDESVRTLARNNAQNPQNPQNPPMAAGAPPPPAPAAFPAPPAPAPFPPPPPAPAPAPGPGTSPVAAGSRPQLTPLPSPSSADRENEEPPPRPVAAVAPAPAHAPAPTRSAAVAATAQSPVRGQTLQLPGGGTQRPPAVVAPRTASTQGQAAPAAAPPAGAAPVATASNAPPPVVIPASPPPVVPKETPAQAANRLALMTLVDRIADEVDLAPLRVSPVADEALTQAVERAAREQAAAMRDEGEAPEGIDLDTLARFAVRELVGLGPISVLLDDDEITEIQCVRNDQVLAHRGAALEHADASFTSDEALGRVIARLAIQAGEPVAAGELVIERRLARGAQMIAIVPPAAAVYALVIRKRRKVDATLEDLVRSGALSRPMAVFVDACVQARANILLSAPSGTSTAQFVAALASAAPPGERVALLSDVEEVQIPQGHVFAISLADARSRASEQAVRAAARLRPDRLILARVPSDATAPLLEAINEGSEGVIAAVSAPSLRQLLGRLASQLSLSRGLDVASARECVAEAFDVAIEVTTLADGRPRVLRVAELGGNEGKGPRDLFTYVHDGADGSFVAAGIQARAVSDFAARGVKLDPALFKRTR